MTDYIYIGCSPHDEDCVQVRTGENYFPAMKAELIRFKQLMQKVHPEVGSGCYAVRREAHDFGSYLQLIAVYDDEDEEATRWALAAEDAIPDTWEG